MFLSGGVQMSVEKRRRYDREFKLKAVRLSLEPGQIPPMVGPPTERPTAQDMCLSALRQVSSPDALLSITPGFDPGSIFS